MNSFRNIHCRPQVPVIFLVALSLLVVGVRVPDLSHSHRPRPTNRFVLKTQIKTISSSLKQYKDFAGILSKIPTSSDTDSYHAVVDVVPLLYISPLRPNPGRSPPVPEF
jgi:hypothetical protein